MHHEQQTWHETENTLYCSICFSSYKILESSLKWNLIHCKKTVHRKDLLAIKYIMIFRLLCKTHSGIKDISAEPLNHQLFIRKGSSILNISQFNRKVPIFNNQLGDFFETTVGVCQGCSLVPALVNILEKCAIQNILYNHFTSVSISARLPCKQHVVDDIDMSGWQQH